MKDKRLNISASSPDWLAIRRHILNRIEKLRDDLEQTGLEPGQVRGEIAGLRWLMKEIEPDAPLKGSFSSKYMESPSEPDA